MYLKRLFIFLYLTGNLIIASGPQALAQTEQENNVASQPVWGPVGYDHVDYYYLPDVECYYSVATHQFISLNNGRWVFTAGLPAPYRKYDLFTGYKVVINKPRPFLNFTEDKVTYEKYKGLKNEQPPIKPLKVTPPDVIKLPKNVPPTMVPKIPVKPPVVPVLPPVVKPHIF